MLQETRRVLAKLIKAEKIRKSIIRGLIMGEKYPKVYDKALSVIIQLEAAGFKIIKKTGGKENE